MINTFNIAFEEHPGARLSGDSTSIGRIRLGEFTERFEVALGFWGREQYEAQWRAAVEHIVGGASKDALITSLSSPDAAPFALWWPMYREHDHVVFHNQLLLPDQLDGAFKLERYQLSVPERVTTSEKGEAVSEWVVPLDSLREFLHRR